MFLSKGLIKEYLLGFIFFKIKSRFVLLKDSLFILSLFVVAIKYT